MSRRREVPDGNHEFSILWWISWASSNGDTLKDPGHGVTYRVVEEGMPAYLVGELGGMLVVISL